VLRGPGINALPGNRDQQYSMDQDCRALYLIRLAFDNLGEAELVKPTIMFIRSTGRFLVDRLTVEISDIVFSIDNIVEPWQ